MDSLIVIISFSVGLFIYLFERKSEKISWRFLVCSLILSRIPDKVTTVLCLEKVNHDYTMESGYIARWMLTNINLSDAVVLTIKGIIVITVMLVAARFFWRLSKVSRLWVKYCILSLVVASIFASMSNLHFYLFW